MTDDFTGRRQSRSEIVDEAITGLQKDLDAMNQTTDAAVEQIDIDRAEQHLPPGLWKRAAIMDFAQCLANHRAAERQRAERAEKLHDATGDLLAAIADGNSLTDPAIDRAYNRCHQIWADMDGRNTEPGGGE